MKTIVYVDGFNFYYGLLRHSPYKWLDLVKLFEQELLPMHDPNIELIKVKLFTAPVLTKFATNKAQAQNSQDRYWRAMQTLHPDRFELIKGHYQAAYQNAIEYLSPPDKQKRVGIWKLEEKLTDVQMALDLYRDAVREECEQVVIASNDSDMEPAAKLIKTDTNIPVGIILPRLPNDQRPTSKHLRDITDWNINAVTHDQLETCLLPDKIPTCKKPIAKPDYW
ncbi:NYN domain-containing protein [Vibrio ostreicida]|uniref:NYN domain-containing protein n=1 Tax=Vibrio ostreicida TaxID=526588 RepID=UPI003B5CB15B